ncbi:MAG: hypothetical protein RLZZ297_1810 [Chloroflexota bacterium]|jgi:hypothetical protein
MNDTPIRVTYRTSISAAIAAAQLYQSSTLKHRVYQIIALGVFSFTLYEAYRTGFTSTQVLLYAIATLLFIDPVPLILMAVTRLGQPDLPTTATADATGISLTTGDRTVTHPWAHFTSSVENQRFLLLVIAPWNYVAIPRAVLHASGHDAQLRALLAASRTSAS